MIEEKQDFETATLQAFQTISERLKEVEGLKLRLEWSSIAAHLFMALILVVPFTIMARLIWVLAIWSWNLIG